MPLCKAASALIAPIKLLVRLIMRYSSPEMSTNLGLWTVRIVVIVYSIANWSTRVHPSALFLHYVSFICDCWHPSSRLQSNTFELLLKAGIGNLNFKAWMQRQPAYREKLDDEYHFILPERIILISLTLLLKNYSSFSHSFGL